MSEFLMLLAQYIIDAELTHVRLTYGTDDLCAYGVHVMMVDTLIAQEMGMWGITVKSYGLHTHMYQV